MSTQIVIKLFRKMLIYATFCFYFVFTYLFICPKTTILHFFHLVVSNAPLQPEGGGNAPTSCLMNINKQPK